MPIQGDISPSVRIGILVYLGDVAMQLQLLVDTALQVALHHEARVRLQRPQSPFGSANADILA